MEKYRLSIMVLKWTLKNETSKNSGIPPSKGFKENLKERFILEEISCLS